MSCSPIALALAFTTAMPRPLLEPNPEVGELLVRKLVAHAYEDCDWNEDCDSKTCSWLRSGGKKQCCPGDSSSWTHCYVADAGFCSHVEDGKPCECDSVCESGFCRNNYCVAKLDAYEACDDDQSCHSGTCSWLTTNGNRQCCPEGREYICSTQLKWYCNWVAEGKPCECNDVCALGNCQDGTCQAKKPNGATCKGGLRYSPHRYQENGSCESGACLPTDWYKQDPDYYCAPKQANGEPCLGDVHCLGGLCDSWCADLSTGEAQGKCADCKEGHNANGMCKDEREDGC